MTRKQSTRADFYLSLLKITILIGGSVTVVEVPNTDRANGAHIGAILMWLPPHVRPSSFSIKELYKSGFLGLMMPGRYGLGGFYNVQMVFESNVHSMFAKTLKDMPPNGYKECDCGFVQMLASNPAHAGKGYASKILAYKMEQHFREYPDRPVILDTTTMQGIRAYERLGFDLLAQTAVNTGTDAFGIKLKSKADEATRQRAKEVCVQSVMIKTPPPLPGHESQHILARD
jgi:GNAT superfamily N-acetyltransferase